MTLDTAQLSRVIDLLQTGRSPRASTPRLDEQGLAMIKMASLLNAHCGPAHQPAPVLPDPHFKAELWTRMVATICEEK